MRLFHDTESGEIITESALMAEFDGLVWFDAITAA